MKISDPSSESSGGAKFLIAFFSGGMAGLVAKTLVAPLDRMKIIFQVTNEKFTFSNMPKIFSHVVEKEGFLSLWKGNSAMILRIAPYAALQFMTYEQMKAWFVRKSGTDNSVGSYSQMISELMVCGGVAGAVSSAATYPLDLARSRLAVELNCQKSATRHQTNRLSLRVFSLIYQWAQTSGIRGLYSGITPTILGIIPYGAISFTTNAVTKRMVQEFTGRELQVWQKLLCGAVAGASAQTIVYPLEMVRRRMQTVGHVDRNAYLSQLTKSSSPSPSPAVSPTPCPPSSPPEPVLSMRDVIKDLYRTEGWRGFYKGVALNWIKGPITVGISFTAYDFFKKFSEDLLETRAS